MGVVPSTPHNNTFGNQWYHQNNFPIDIDCNSDLLVYLLIAKLWRPRPRWVLGVALNYAYTPTLPTHGYYQKIFPVDPRDFVKFSPP